MDILKPLKRYAFLLLPGLILGLIVGWILVGLLFSSTSPFLHMLISSMVAVVITYLILHRRTKNNIVGLTDNIDYVAIGAAKISHEIDSFQVKTSEQGVLANQLASSTQNLANESENFSNASNKTVETASQAYDIAEKGQQSIEEILTKTSRANEKVMSTSAAFSRLQHSTDKIHDIIEIINEIMLQTHLLSLNAAIEAAQAGKYGMGFSVVADEIRSLSGKTKESTKNIDNILQEILKDSNDAENTIKSLTTEVNGVLKSTEEVSELLAVIKGTAGTFQELSQKMARSLENHVEPIKNISHSIHSMNTALESTAKQSSFSSEHALNLTKQTEYAHELLFKFGRLDNKHHNIYVILSAAAKKIERLFVHALAEKILLEEDLFDRNYLPIANTNPKKYTSRFDAFTDEYLLDIQEPVLNANPNIVYIMATTVDGYVPTHNLRFSHALTGEYKTDLLNSRSKRIFTDRVGQRCGKHTKKFLLQTYKRDTGEVLHDLSVPLFINGKHWGGLRTAYKAAE